MARLEKDYSSRARGYDQHRYLNPKATFTAAAETGLLRRAIMAHAADRRLLVDVACGTGHFTWQVADLFQRVVGIDLTAAMLARARTRHLDRGDIRVELVQGSATQLPVADGIADVVLSTRFLHLFERRHHARLVEHLLRIVRPGGLLVIEHDWAYGVRRRFRTGYWSTYHPSEMPRERALRLERIGILAPGLPTLARRWPRAARWLGQRCAKAPLNRLATRVIIVYRKR